MHDHIGMDSSKDEEAINIEIEKELNALTERDLDILDDEEQVTEAEDDIAEKEV